MHTLLKLAGWHRNLRLHSNRRHSRIPAGRSLQKRNEENRGNRDDVEIMRETLPIRGKLNNSVPFRPVLVCLITGQAKWNKAVQA